MKRFLYGRLIGFLMVAGAVFASVNAAQDLYWTGSASSQWNYTAKNWTNSLGEVCAFTAGDNAHFAAVTTNVVTSTPRSP